MGSPRLALLLLAAACGDIQTVGGGGDGGANTDAGSPDARAVGSITVTVGPLFGESQPLAGNQVIVVDSAGEVAADLETDADGVATADDIEAGSTLIILIAAPPTGAPPGSQALVIVGVEPGDDIHIDPEDREGTLLGAMNITWEPFAGASNYFVDTGCSSTITSDNVTTLDFFLGCAPGGEIAALIRAADGADTTLAWLGGLGLYDAEQPFELGDNWAVPRNLDVTLSEIPSEARQARIGLRPSRAGVVFQRVDMPVIELTEATAEVTLPLPRAFADSDLVTLDFQSNQPSFGENSLAVRVAPSETELAVALAGELVPWYGSPLYDSEARALHWARSSGVDPDAQFLSMFWMDKDGTAGATFIMAPPGITSVTVPELPPSYERFLPGNPASVGIQLQAAESTDVDGYRAARQTGFSLIFNPPMVGLEAPSTLRRASAGDDF
jgi:hypothetical protein